MPPVSVSVIIVNWYSRGLLDAALDSLNAQTVQPSRIIVVNNGDDARLTVDHYDKGPIEVIEMGHNVGFAAANNYAIRNEADTEWVALLNPDALTETDWLERLMDAVSRHPDVVAFGSKQIMANDRKRIDGLGDVYHVSGAAWRDGYGLADSICCGEIREVFSPCGAAALYRRDAFLEAGGFDEDYFCYFEDVDLGFRLRLLGYRCMYVPQACVYHFGSATSGGEHSDFSTYHGHRNLIWTYAKNMPTSMFWLHLPEHLLFNLASVLLCIKRHQGMVIARALKDAACGLPKVLSKRRKIQSTMRATAPAIRAAMAYGWLMPYLSRAKRCGGARALPDSLEQ